MITAEKKSITESVDNQNKADRLEHPLHNWKYGAVGVVFGVTFVKAELVSWFRMQEMFRFQSFYLYWVLCLALFTAVVTVQLVKRLKLKTFHGEPISTQPKRFHKGLIIGGLLFGMGWAITGACPGPLFAQIGAGYTVVVVTLLSAIAGTWTYGKLRDKLPH